MARGFVKVPIWLLEQCADSRAIHLYAWLAKQPNLNHVWRTVEELARELRSSPRNIDRALAELKHLGAIRVERYRRGDGTLGRAMFVPLDLSATGGGQATRTLSATRGALDSIDLSATGGAAYAAPPAAPQRSVDRSVQEDKLALHADHHPVHAVENRDAPTEAQLMKLAHETLTQVERSGDGFTSIADVAAATKAHAAQLSGFDYAANMTRFHRALARVLSARGYAAGGRR